MKNLCKKLLACCLAVCMVLTLCVGALTVSASEVTDDYVKVGTVDVTTADTEAVVPVSILSTGGIAAARINVSVPSDLTISKLELDTDDEDVEITYASAANPTGAPIAIDSEEPTSEVAPNIIDGVFTYIVELPAGEVTTDEVTLNITFAGTFAEGTIAVAVDVESCKDEKDLITLTEVDGVINVAAAHVCEDVYKDNGDGTHTITCANGCDKNDTEDHDFVDGKCVCGAEEVTGPELDENLGTTCLSKASMTVDSKVNLRYEFGFRVGGQKLDFDAVTFEFKKPEWDNNYNFTGEYKTTTLTDADNKSNYGAAGIYVFEYSDINLNEMSLKIEATITLYKDGVATKYYKFEPISLAERAQAWYKTSLDEQNTKNLTMAVDLLNMGTAFQKYFADAGNNKEANIDAGKQCDFAALPLPNVLDAGTGETVDQSYASSPKTLTDENPIRDTNFQLPSIETLSTLTLRYSFREATFTTPSNVVITASYDDSLNGSLNFVTNANTLPEDFLKYSSSGIYTYTFDKVPLYDLDKLVTLTVTDGNKTITYQISVLAKVTEMLGKTTGLAYDNFNAIAIFAASCDSYFSF